MMKVPGGFETWKEAIGAYVKARDENGTPDSIDENIWTVFETMAFELIPEINKYVFMPLRKYTPSNNFSYFEPIVLHSDYKNNKDWLKYDFNRVVTPSDEAFVWQIMTYYYPVWVEEKEADANGARAGPKKGFKNTTGKTVKTFQKYLHAVGSSRSAGNSKLWSGRLKYIAQKQEREDREKKRLDTESEQVCTIEEEQDTGYLKYAKLRLGGFDREEDIDSNDDTDTLTNSSSTDTTVTEDV
jgi:hypothetical protein